MQIIAYVAIEFVGSQIASPNFWVNCWQRKAASLHWLAVKYDTQYQSGFTRKFVGYRY